MFDMSTAPAARGAAAMRGRGNRSQAPDGKLRTSFIFSDELVDRIDEWQHAHRFPTRASAVVAILTRAMEEWSARIAEEPAPKAARKGKR